MKYDCLQVEKDPGSGQMRRRVAQRQRPEIDDGQCLVQIEFSALNYKDALAATGHPGVARQFPLVPGIDAAGFVLESRSPRFTAGDRVLVAHADFGTLRDGGFSQLTAVHADWLVALPASLDSRLAATLGTAAFTAAQCLESLQAHQVTPLQGPVVVSGASGGVGIFAVKLLSQLGYHVVASSGKLERRDWLIEQGAREVVGRDALHDSSQRPLLSARWAGGVDTVGGMCLATMLRSTKPHGCVTACGVVGGADLPLTVYPFILRGVTLSGIDSAGVTRESRQRVWNKLADEWRLNNVDALAEVVGLRDLDRQIDAILAGRIAGRIVVDLRLER